MEDLRGKVAVITGGASGIGLATAKMLAGEGMKIVIADIERAALDKATREVEAAGAECLGVVCDVSRRDDVVKLADAAFGHFGKVHLLFNNAGVAVFGPVQEMTHNDWQWSIDVNLWGPINGCEVFVPRMIEQGEGGHVLSTASFAGMVPNESLAVYCVTKYGVVALMECLRRDVKPYGIGASVLCPMIIRTNIEQSQRNRPAELGGPEASRPRTAEEEERLQGRVLELDEVTPLILDAIRNDKLYIFTHEESRRFIRNRFDRIDAAFEA